MDTLGVGILALRFPECAKLVGPYVQNMNVLNGVRVPGARYELDPDVLFVKVASTAVVTAMLGGGKDEVMNAISNAWIDNAPLRTFLHASNTGSRKSWAAGDATSRAVWLAFTALRGEMGYKNALTAPRWGFQDVVMNGKAITLSHPLGSRC